MSNRHTPALSECRANVARELFRLTYASYADQGYVPDNAALMAEDDLLILMGLSVGATAETAKARAEVQAIFAAVLREVQPAEFHDEVFTAVDVDGDVWVFEHGGWVPIRIGGCHIDHASRRQNSVFDGFDDTPDTYEGPIR